MSNPKRPDLSGIPRLTEQLEGEELTAHFAVPRELLEQLRDDEATRVQMMPAGLLEGEAISESVHTSPTLPPPAPAPQLATVQVAPAQVAPAPPATTAQATLAPVVARSPSVVRVAFPAPSDAEVDAEIRAMRRSSRIALAWLLFLAVALVVFTWRLLSD